jgi:uncharacterized protein (TIGR00299 family) protein
MKKILYLEPVGGIAGDMFLAAAIDLGVSPEELRQRLGSLDLPTWKLSASRAVRHAITGIHVDVEVQATARPGRGRKLSEIRLLIQSAPGFSARVRERALAVFDLIGRVEAKIHDIPLEEVHFHEVGAVDSIVDICGAAVALEMLGDPEMYSAPPPLGSGTVQTAHGNLPIPAPATLAILTETPVRFEGVGELTTPTGAALLKALGQVRAPPEFLLERVGYGVGTRELADRPNVLRASLGRVLDGEGERMLVIETNVDDCSPQLLGGILEELTSLGALDAYVLPATMKKSRPGHLLGAIVPESRKDAIVDALLLQSTTIGVRVQRTERIVLERSFDEVDTPHGTIRIKLAMRNGEVVNAQPEFEDCRQIAQKRGIPVKRVWAEALASYHRPRAPKDEGGDKR